MTDSPEYQPKDEGSGIFMSRRRFWKGAVGVGAAKVLGGTGVLYTVMKTSGCLNMNDNGDNNDNNNPDPKYSIKIRGTDGSEIVYGPKGYDGEPEDSFQRGVVNMLDVMSVYSPEWFEKTLYAGEVVKAGRGAAGGKDGTIYLSKWYISGLDKKDVKTLLSASASFPHEVQHVIDQNIESNYSTKRDITFTISGSKKGQFELELRAGIAEDIYRDEIMEKAEIDLFGPSQRVYEYGRNSYGSSREWFENNKKKVAGYKDRLDIIEEMHFDHENRELKTDFLDKSFEEFKNL